MPGISLIPLTRPVAYLAKCASISNDAPHLSDGPLSDEGIKQAKCAAEWFMYEPIRSVTSLTDAASTQFATIIQRRGCIVEDTEFPQLTILPEGDAYVSSVGPGGIVAVYADDQGSLNYIPRLNVIAGSEQN